MKLKFSFTRYANNLPSEMWMNRQEAPKLHSPLRNFLQYGGSLVPRCGSSDLKVDGELVPELGWRGAGAAAPPGCGAGGVDNVPTGFTLSAPV